MPMIVSTPPAGFCGTLTRERPIRNRLVARIRRFEPVPNGEFKALVKGDGGLIVYGPGRAVWPRCHATAGVRRSRLRSESHPPDAERPLSGTRSAQTLALSLSQ